MPKEAPEVRPNQVWADNDPRSAGRTLRVDAIDGDKAVCTITANDRATQEYLDDPANRGKARVRARDMQGKTTRISLSRFKPTSTGYRLVSDTPEEG